MNRFWFFANTFMALLGLQFVTALFIMVMHTLLTPAPEDPVVTGALLAWTAITAFSTTAALAAAKQDW